MTEQIDPDALPPDALPGDTSFLPPDDDPIPDPDEVLDAIEATDDDSRSFLDEDDQADVITVDAPPPPLGLSWAFDFSTNTFLMGGIGGPLETRGLATLRGWIEKCLMTARGAHPIHPPDYGVEGLTDIIGDAATPEVAGGLEEVIRDALLFHPRITEVVDFAAFVGEHDDLDTSITPDDETLFVSFTVVTDDEETIDFIGIPLRGS
jgi:Protein of unknown function (DUF2634)